MFKRSSLVLFSLALAAVLLGQDSYKFEIACTVAPDAAYTIDQYGFLNEHSFVGEISFKVPHSDRFRFGVQLQFMYWAADEIYPYERNLIFGYENRKSEFEGVTSNIYGHNLFGWAPTITWAGSDKFSHIRVNTSILIGKPGTVFKTGFAGDAIREVVYVPIIGTEYRFFDKFPWLVGRAQCAVIPNYRPSMSIQLGARVGL